MKKSVIAFLLLCSLGYPFLIKAQVTPFLAGRLQYTLDSVCARYKIKGTSAAVLIPGAGVWKGVNGSSEEGVPLTSDMLFGMGSNTKTHIAATLLKMQEQQLLLLDDTIGEWIQGYPNINGQITIRQCLNHTSGLFDYMQNGSINDSVFDVPGKIWNRAEILNLAKEPNFAPGTNWSYSNTNYIIAGIIIEKVMNESPYKTIHDLVLAPHQLTNTVNFGEQGGLGYAHPWSMQMNGVSLTDMTTTPFLDNLFSLANTAGSLITTAEDNVHFWYKLWHGEIINPQSWKEMTTLRSIGNNDGYGLGIFLNSKKMNGRTIYSHGGTFFGYINENMVDTLSGVTIAVLTNQDSVNNSGLSALVIRALHKAVLNMPATGIAEQLTKDQVLVYPNPASDNISVTVNGPSFSGTVVITDMIGNEISKEEFVGTAVTIHTLSIPSGMYFVTIKNENGSRLTSRIQIIH
jgi:D-alanyl-D-alanine carboxypeptidase